MEEEIAQEEKLHKKSECKIVTDIKSVPKSLIFTKFTTFKVFNRNNNTHSYIKGVQAEALLGMQKTAYEKIKNGEIDAFSTENEYIKFEKAKISV